MSSSYSTSEGRKLLLALIETIDANGAYLSEIDGATGDGDHGINMTKGVRRTREKLGEQNVTVPQGLDLLGQVLLAEIGGAMGPLMAVSSSTWGPPVEMLPPSTKRSLARC